MESLMAKWQKTDGIARNEVLDGGDFYISYANTSGGPGFMRGDGDGIETALRRKDGRDGWMILNGDYRAQYEKLMDQGYDACKRFYEQQSAHADSSWSDTTVA